MRISAGGTRRRGHRFYLSPASTCRTLGRASSESFIAGDRLLLQGGHTFPGTPVLGLSGHAGGRPPVVRLGAGLTDVAPRNNILLSHSAGSLVVAEVPAAAVALQGND